MFINDIENSLSKRFRVLKLDVIDVRRKKKPKRESRAKPEGWDGWLFSFKLSYNKDKLLPNTTRIRQALVPSGSSSSKIEIQISENEWCFQVENVIIDKVEVRIYTAALMVAEKIRAICQQHPSYRHSLGKHRARDFYDIYMIHSKNYQQPDFTKHIADIISDVFKEKAVPIDIITEGKIFDSKFITQQEHGFNAVRDAVDGKVQDFSFYVESMKLLVQDINRYHQKMVDS